MTTPVPFRNIVAKCIPVMESLCRRWLPQGHRSGSWWVSPCPWRADKTPSLMVSLTTGHWEDRGAAIAGKEKGDPLKLFLCLYPGSCRDMVDAADQVARIVGHEFRQARRS
jgi:hypothetical protein